MIERQRTQEQISIRWRTPSEVRDAWAWREKLIQVAPDGPWTEVNVSRGTHALQIISTSTMASAWIAASHSRFAQEPSLAHLGRPRLVRSEVCACAVPSTTRAAMVVIAKAGEPWEQWRSPRLTGKAREELAGRFSVQLSRRLADFAVVVDPDALCVRVIDDGEPRPIPIPGTRGFALARKDLKLELAWRIAGEVAVGRLVKVGYGRLFAAE